MQKQVHRAASAARLHSHLLLGCPLAPHVLLGSSLLLEQVYAQAAAQEPTPQRRFQWRLYASRVQWDFIVSQWIASPSVLRAHTLILPTDSPTSALRVQQTRSVQRHGCSCLVLRALSVSLE